MRDSIKVMDVTLRDGSYAINFQFSESDTSTLCKILEESGIEYIEIGHGMGLNASSAYNGEALCSDEEYLYAAQQTCRKAKYGMFCIPGIARISDIDLLKNYGGSFIRVGTNVTEIEHSKEYIEKAKRCGLEVMANYMKSYVATAEEFREGVRLSKSYGADIIYVVDSAGGMFPEDIKKYYDVISEEGMRAGFHGHDNLGLAVANSLYAMELGFEFIDTSLKGMGRSAGNASTELLVANMQKRYDIQKYNCKKLLEFGERYIKPIYKNAGYNALDVYCGIAEFHTSYMKSIHKYASKYMVNPLDLIIEYTKVDKVSMNEALLEQIALQLPKSDCNLMEFGFGEYFGNEQMRENGRRNEPI